MAHKIQIKRGNKADLPTLDVGEFGLCQDTNELFIGNNGNQKIFPPTALDTLAAEVVAHKAENVINVKAFGAHSIDEVGYEDFDSSSSIQTLINSRTGVFTGGGKTYKCSSKIIIPDNVTLKNMNIVASADPETNGDGILTIAGDNIGIKNINIDAGAKPHSGIFVQNGDNCEIENVNITNSTWSGIFAENLTNSKISRCKLDSIGGIYLGGALQIGTGSSNVLVEFCTISNALGKGFVASHCADVRFSHCKSHNAIYENFAPVKGSVRTKFYKCISTKDRVDDISSGLKCTRGGEDIVFEECVFEQLGGTGVVSPFHIQGCSNILVRKCKIKGNTSQAVLISWHPEDPNTEPITPATPANNITFENCTIDAVNGGIGIRIDPSFGFTHLEDITIDGCKFYNYVNAIYATHIKNLKIINNKFKISDFQTLDTNNTISIYGTAETMEYSANSTVEGNTFEGMAGRLRLYYTQDFHIEKNYMIGKLATTTLVLVDHAKNGHISKNTLKAFSTGINIESHSAGIEIIKNNFFNDGTGTAIRQNGTNQTIIGNNFDVSTPLNPASGGTNTIYELNSNQINLKGSVTWNPGRLEDGAGETSAAITVTGAALGDFVIVSAPYDLQGICCNGYVSATDTVKIRIQNETGGIVDLGSGLWKVKVIKA